MPALKVSTCSEDLAKTALQSWIEIPNTPDELRTILRIGDAPDLDDLLRRTSPSVLLKLKWRAQVVNHMRMRIHYGDDCEYEKCRNQRQAIDDLIKKIDHHWQHLSRIQRVEAATWVMRHAYDINELENGELRNIAGSLGAIISSRDIDRILQLQTREIFEAEERIGRRGMQRFGHDDETNGGGAVHQAYAMLTHYDYLVEALIRANPQAGNEIVDLGAGLGRLGFAVEFAFPNLRFTGYELVPDRIHEAARAA